MPAPRLTQQVKMDMMTALKAATKPLNTATLILFTNDVADTDDHVIGDFTEASFGGYAAVAAQVFGNVFIGPDRKIWLAAPSVEFVMTDLSALQTIKGYAIVKADKSVVYYHQTLDAPVNLVRVNQGFLIQPVLPYGA